MAEKKHHKGGKKGTAKYGRNEAKCKRYRIRVGKPRGPGVAGCKSGSKWTARVMD